MIKLLKYLKKYWYIAILAPIFMILEVLMDMIMTVYMEKMIDYGIQTSNMDNVIKYGLIMLGILSIGVVCGILSGVFTNLTSYKFANDLRKDVYKKIMNLSCDQTDKFSTGSLVTRVTNDITQVQNMISMMLRMLIRALSFFVLGIIFTINIDLSFGIIIAIVLPIEILILILFVKLIFPIFTKIQKKLDKINTVVHENVSGAREVKAFCHEDYEYNRFYNVNDDYTASVLHANKISSFMMPLLMILIYISQVIIYYFGGSTIFDAFNGKIGVDEMIKVGQINQAITYISMICMSIMMFGMMFTNLARAFASAKRINELLDCKLTITDGNEKVNNIKGIIEYKNVSFKYPLATGNVLEDISFKINKGETIAIVGSTGCGKSSLVNLLVRFYDVNDGQILIDNINVKDYSLYDLREKIAICLQKAELFKGTIRENIKWGNEKATEEEIIDACNISQSSEFVFAKEKGLDEIVEEKGSSLSGGQKQRLSIARAILKKPEILVFDDSTSALDLITEAKLYEGLKNSLHDTTKIIVVQRIASAKYADKILVLDNKKVVAFDTHDNLIKNNKIYQDIYYSQLMKEEC